MMSRQRSGYESGSTVSTGRGSSRGDSGLSANKSAVEQARNMLIGAVDTLIQLATNPQEGPRTSQCGTARRSNQWCSGSTDAGERWCYYSLQSNSNVGERDYGRGGAVTNIQEHRQLFGFRRRAATTHNFEPSKATVSQVHGRRNKGKGRMMLCHGAGRPGRNTWRKSCICLKCMHQTCKPSAAEKMELARIGLGLAELTFVYDGDAEHIHSVLVGQFPQLDTCGGYTLLRLNDNSHNLIEIEHPAKGMTVPYLKDILNQAKLYVRPLQRNIAEGDSYQVCMSYSNYCM